MQLEVKPETALRLRDWMARDYRQALAQYGVPIWSGRGVRREDLDRPGTWIANDLAALIDLDKAIGGRFAVGACVLAQEVGGDQLYRRYRVTATDYDQGVATATEAWSGGIEKEHQIDLATAIYIG